MNANDKVRLTKLGAFHETEDALEDNYTLVGYLMGPIRVGQIIDVWRTMRNGVEIQGHFTSSAVVEIKGDLVSTQNSLWRVEVLETAEHRYGLGDIRFD